MNNVNSRNYGIDIARIVSMFFVVVLHNLLQGGVLNNPNLTGGGFVSAWMLENLSIIAVNVFAMISGYLAVGRNFHLSRVVMIVIQTVFWSWVVLLLLVLSPINVSFTDVLLGIVPVTFFWYINSYIGLMLLMPFILPGLQEMPKKIFLPVLGALLSISVTIGFIRQFSLNDGMSILWILILFLLGFYIRKFQIFSNVRTSILLVTYVMLACLSGCIEFVLHTAGKSLELMISYNSPIVLLESIVFFVAVSRIRITNKNLQKLLLKVSPATLGVYIIDSSLFYKYVLLDLFKPIASMAPLLIITVILIASSIFFVLFIILEMLRIKFFNSLNVNKKVNSLIIRLSRIFKLEDE